MVVRVLHFFTYTYSVRSLTFRLCKLMHFKCRNGLYPRSEIKRFPVPDEKVSWEVPWKEYSPENYTSNSVIQQRWADNELRDFSPKWYTIDGNVNRVSHVGLYHLDSEGFPLNPVGRTGLAGRGVLGRWGPNHAADSIVTRWRRGDDGIRVTDKVTQSPILQFVAIERRDCKQWAIPGGMVDPGEIVATTLRREFFEEALNSLEKEQVDLEVMVKDFFNKGEEVFKGYVDDPRNTDNAWMETVAFNFHDESGESVGQFKLEAGDDAQRVRWMDLHRGLQLYASHSDLLKKVAEIRSAHW